jgi:WD40 repeat protein
MVQDGQPVPKVIDFGVAKATDQRLTERTLFTQHGLLVGTPEYMSPEQAEMSGLEVDTTTDIYSLGVMLYELLVGARPFEADTLRAAGYDEIRRLIREVDPPKPTTRLHSLGDTGVEVAQRRRTSLKSLGREIRGDLEWITLKALEKDRTRRYASASEFAADIGRHLNDDAILAHRPSRAYRIRKFVRRHRIAVAAATVLVALLAATGVVTTWLYLEADQARTEAEHEAYAASIAAADGHLRLDQPRLAVDRLRSTPPRLRGWEWWHLFLKADSSVARLDWHEQTTSFPWSSSLIRFTRDGSRAFWATQFIVHEVDPVDMRKVGDFGGFGTIHGLAADASRVITQRTTAGGVEVRVVEPQTGRVVKNLGTHRRASAIALSDDGNTWAFSPEEGTLWIGGVDGTPRIFRLARADEDYSWSLFSPDGTLIAFQSGDEVQLRTVDAFRLRTRITGPGALRAAFSPDGARLAIATSSRQVRIFQVDSAQPIWEVTLGDPAVSLAFSADGGLLATGGSQNGILHIWDLSKSPQTAAVARLAVDAFPGTMMAVAFAPDRGKLIAGSDDNNLRFWNLQRLNGRSLVGRGSDAVAVSPVGSRMAVADGRGRVEVWDLSTLGLERQVEVGPGSVRSMSFSRTGERIAVSFDDGRVEIWRWQDNHLERRLEAGETAVASLEFSLDDQFLATASEDDTARVWDLASGRVLRTLALDEDVNVVRFEAASGNLLVGSGDNNRALMPGSATVRETTRIWDWRQDRVLAARDARSGGSVDGLAVSPGGKVIVLSGNHRPVAHVWNAALQEAIGELPGEVLIRSVAISPDGRRIAVGDFAGTIGLFDATTFDRLLSLEDLKGRPIEELAFTADGRQLVSRTSDGVVVWDSASAYHPDTGDVLADLRARLTFARDIEDHLLADDGLDVGLRRAALAATRAIGDNPRSLSDQAWEVVRLDSATREAYALAYRKTDEASRIWPWDATIRMRRALGLYRLGRFKEALETVTDAAEQRLRSDDFDTAVRILALSGMGQDGSARDELRRLEEKLKAGDGQVPDALAALMNEARARLTASREDAVR